MKHQFVTVENRNGYGRTATIGKGRGYAVVQVVNIHAQSLGDQEANEIRISIQRNRRFG
jgi:hypothetical protein